MTSFVLSPSEGKEVAFAAQGDFADAAFAAIRDVTGYEELYAFWQRNRKTLLQLKSTGQGRSRGVLADALIAALKAKSQSLGRLPAGVTFDLRGTDLTAPQVQLGVRTK